MTHCNLANLREIVKKFMFTYLNFVVAKCKFPMHLFRSKTEENLPACMLSCRGMIGLIIIDGCLSKSFLVKIFINAIGS